MIHWFTNLVSGLLFLETHHIVHRDLKMENLLLSVDGNLVLSDFRKAILLNSDFELEYENGKSSSFCIVALLILSMYSCFLVR